ncbi:MAG: aldehyde dehydrogenase family protein [Streptosporangiales bacterium]|nr:aldehyde dehydrogenase family protein [Streptosporangiales bacterium]
MTSWDRLTADNFIAGRRRGSVSGETRVDIAPASGIDIGDVTVSNEEDVADAYVAAADAAPRWRAMGAEERRGYLLAWAAAVRARLDDIALVDAVDSGTPLRTMRTGVAKGAEYIEYYAGLGQQLRGATIPATPGHLHYTVREPYGVVAVIIPFNHPAYFAMSKTVPALMAGNTVVLKPADQTPLSATMIADASAGILPAGVFNVVHGGARVGRALAGHPDIWRVHFTGGVDTGLAVQKTAAESGRVKHVSLELGGKNPLLAFPDADPTEVAEAAVVGMNFTRNQGQSCGSTSRLFVPSSMASEVTDEVCALAAKIRLGMPELEDTEMGSLVSPEHQDRVLGFVEEGVSEGARLRVGGERPSGDLAGGAFVKPTVLDRVTPELTVAREEIFGPVLSVITWDTEDELFSMVNDSDYGLTAAIYTHDLATAHRAAARVESGYIWVNGVEKRWKGVPFGGYKNSGLGSEHDLAEMETYTRTKAVTVMLPS